MEVNLNDRLKLFLWKIAWDIVPSKSRLNSVFPIPQADLVCPLYNVEEDFISHLFFRCFFTRISWRLSPWPLDSLKWSALSLADWIEGILTHTSSFGINCADSHFFQIFATILCDVLWFYRNQAVHKGVIPDVSTIVANINCVSLEHFTAWSSKLHPIKEVWSKPPHGFCKVNFDTAIREGFSTQAVVCINSNGMIIKALTQVRPICNPVYGEALAAQLAGVLANSLKLDRFILEGDSNIVILSLNNPTLSIDWHIDHVILETLASFQVFSHWEARNINRSVNFCIYYVAYRGHSKGYPGLHSLLFSPEFHPYL
jgi:hypothetical protein